MSEVVGIQFSLTVVRYSRTANRSKKRRFIRGLADYFDDYSVAGVKKVKVEPKLRGDALGRS